MMNKLWKAIWNKKLSHDAWVALICLLSFFSAYYLSVFVHEMGHQVVAWLCGMRIEGIYVTPFGTCFSLSHDLEATRWRRELIIFAGCATQFAISFIVFKFFVDRVKAFWSRLFVIQFGFVGMILSMAYLSSSILNRYGDGGELVKLMSVNKNIVVGCAIVLIIITFRMVARKALAFGEKYFNVYDCCNDAFYNYVVLFMLALPAMFMAVHYEANYVLLGLCFGHPWVLKWVTGYERHGLEKVSNVPVGGWVFALVALAISLLVYVKVFGTTTEVFYLRRNKAADKLYSELIRLRPKKAEYYNSRALFRYYRGDYDGAAKDMSKYDELVPEIKVEQLKQKIYAEMKSGGNYSVLIDDNKRLIRMTDDIKDIQWATYNIGCYYGRMGDNKRAMKWLHKAARVGYNDFMWVRFDKDWFRMAKTREFKVVLAAMKKNVIGKHGIIIKEKLLMDR